MDIKTKLHVTNIFGNDLASVRKSEVTFTLSKLAYVGMCMLDLNKVFIYEFHYDYIKIKYGNNSSLSITNTGSLVYEIKTRDIYEEFSKDKKCLIFIII